MSDEPKMPRWERSLRELAAWPANQMGEAPAELDRLRAEVARLEEVFRVAKVLVGLPHWAGDEHDEFMGHLETAVESVIASRERKDGA